MRDAVPGFPELRLFSSIGATTPVWGPDGELELRRWNRRFPGPARPEPRWCADGLVLARSLQDQLWDVEVRYHEDDDPAPVRGRRR